MKMRVFAGTWSLFSSLRPCYGRSLLLFDFSSHPESSRTTIIVYLQLG